MKRSFLVDHNIKTIIIIVAAMISLSLTIIAYLSPDKNFGSWICDNGKWISYDNPFLEKPSVLCPSATPTPLPVDQQLQKVAIKIYFARREGKSDSACDEVYPVEREIMAALDKQVIAMEAIDELIKGPTTEEKLMGYYSDITEEDVRPEQINYNNGIVTINTNSVMQARNESFCQTAKKVSQIASTIQDLPFVRQMMSVNPS